MENTHGNMYKSILLTSQDKSHAVIQRSLQKHNIESCQPDVFQLVQLLSERKELTIPDSANVYYSTNTTANFDFVLRWRTRES
ncbi:ral guanine nucleotide dissociation stimulator-like 1 [Xenopus laevis]|uniref:Ral guanine nucleotide dissociation stimulator-like 1 n=1 Tax=Xenopus laevis TaxID=8355 RepID=A0A8J1MST2_XENLA|nr:ral guanine nucleotide dissociation stimulator-like 1 [Xenopus laevis]